MIPQAAGEYALDRRSRVLSETQDFRPGSLAPGAAERKGAGGTGPEIFSVHLKFS